MSRYIMCRLELVSGVASPSSQRPAAKGTRRAAPSSTTTTTTTNNHNRNDDNNNRIMMSAIVAPIFVFLQAGHHCIAQSFRGVRALCMRIAAATRDDSGVHLHTSRVRYIYVCVYIYIYTHTYVCIYIYTCIYINI